MSTHCDTLHGHPGPLLVIYSLVTLAINFRSEKKCSGSNRCLCLCLFAGTCRHPCIRPQVVQRYHSRRGKSAAMVGSDRSGECASGVDSSDEDLRSWVIFLHHRFFFLSLWWKAKVGRNCILFLDRSVSLLVWTCELRKLWNSRTLTQGSWLIARIITRMW